jgi:hypothetical protein
VCSFHCAIWVRKKKYSIDNCAFESTYNLKYLNAVVVVMTTAHSVIANNLQRPLGFDSTQFSTHEFITPLYINSPWFKKNWIGYPIPNSFYPIPLAKQSKQSRVLKLILERHGARLQKIVPLNIFFLNCLNMAISWPILDLQSSNLFHYVHKSHTYLLQLESNESK